MVFCHSNEKVANMRGIPINRPAWDSTAMTAPSQWTVLPNWVFYSNNRKIVKGVYICILSNETRDSKYVVSSILPEDFRAEHQIKSPNTAFSLKFQTALCVIVSEHFLRGPQGPHVQTPGPLWSTCWVLRL